jgi:hypothetical protein
MNVPKLIPPEPPVAPPAWQNGAQGARALTLLVGLSVLLVGGE